MSARGGEATPREQLIAALGERHVLLLLDNCEHLAGAAAEIAAALLAGCTGLTILATSRVPLHIRAERELPVPPLAVPDGRAGDLTAQTGGDAITLFAQRATSANPRFTLTDENAGTVAAICARLDGLPLAIELAAARIKALPPAALLARLERQLDLLTGGARDLPARQRTMRATIGWSYDLLPPDERQLLAALAVFQGAFSLEAAEAVAASAAAPRADLLDGVSALVDQNLLVPAATPDGEPRYRMLETIRQFALDRLRERDGEDAARRAHAHYFLDFGERIAPELTGPDQAHCLMLIEREIDNLRAALDWLFARRGEESARLAVALRWFWYLRGHFSEGRSWLEQALPFAVDDVVRCRALMGLGILTASLGDKTRAADLYEEARALYRQVGDRRGVANALSNLGLLAFEAAEYDRASALHEEALSIHQQLGDEQGASRDLTNLGIIAHRRGDFARATRLHEESLAHARRLGDARGVAIALHRLGFAAQAAGDAPLAAARYEESLALARAVGNPLGVAATMNNLGTLALASGDLASAAHYLEESLALQRSAGDVAGVARALINLGNIARDQADLKKARSLHTEGLKVMHETLDRQGTAEALEALAAALAVEDGAQAVRLISAADTLRAEIGTPMEPANQAAQAEVIDGIRQRIGPSAFDDAWSAGRRASWESIVAGLLAEEDHR